MTDLADPDVLIVGAGAAGLAAARALVEQGVRSVLVVDRDQRPGGLPQYCEHPGFGWEYTRRLETGPRFVGRMLRALEEARVRVLSRTTVLQVGEGPWVQLVGPGVHQTTLSPRAVILTTGIREAARGPRLTPGARPERGLLTTGQLQQSVVRGVTHPFRRMVVCGTEHVAYSALITGRRAGIRTIAMVEPGAHVASYAAARWAARWLGARTYTSAAIVDIRGHDLVEGISLATPDGEIEIDCDSVLFSGGWVPDAVLAQESGLAVDPRTRGPSIDQLMRTSMTGVFAAGNVLRGVESSGHAALEGARAGASVAAFLRGRYTRAQSSAVALDAIGPVEYVVPQRWDLGAPALPGSGLAIRLAADVRGRLQLRSADTARPLTRTRPFHRSRQLYLRADRLAEVLGRSRRWEVTVR